MLLVLLTVPMCCQAQIYITVQQQRTSLEEEVEALRKQVDDFQYRQLQGT